MSIGFSVYPTNSGTRPLTIYVSGVPDSRLNPIYTWDFGDGTITSGLLSQHTYNDGGSFPLQLTVGPTGFASVFSDNFNYLGPFWTNCIDSGLFSNQNNWKYINNEGMLSCISDAVNQISITTLSGAFRVTGGCHIAGSTADSHGFVITDASGVSITFKWNYDMGGELYAEYNGSRVATRTGVSDRDFDIRISKQTNTATTSTQEKVSYFTGIDGGDTDYNPTSNTVCDYFINHRLTITSSGSYLGSDVGQPGTIRNLVFCPDSGISSSNNFQTLKFTEYYSTYNIWIDDIIVRQNNVTKYSGNFDAGTLDNFSNTGIGTAVVANRPTGTGSGKCVLFPKNSGACAIERSLSAPLTRTSGNIEVYYKTCFDGDDYLADTTSWTENNQVFAKFIPTGTGVGFQWSYRPLNFIKDATQTPDFRIWWATQTISSSGNNLIWEYDMGSGNWTYFYNGNYNFYSPYTLKLDQGYNTGVSGNSWSYFLLEADSGLPNSGDPYNDYRSWYYDDFEVDTQLPFTSYFWSGIYVDISGVAIQSNKIYTNQRLSNTLSGEFELISQIRSSTANSHGWRIVDDVSTSNYIELIYGGSQPAIGAHFMYNNPSISSVYQSGTLNVDPFMWWGKIKRTISGPTQTFSSYWASGTIINPSESDWILVNSGVNTASWTIPTGTFNTFYISIDSANDQFGWNELAYNQIFSEAIASEDIYVMGFEYDISGNVLGYSHISGLVYGEYNIPGTVSGVGLINGLTVYERGSIPIPSAPLLKTLLPILSNRRTSPYYSNSDSDYIQAKFELFNKSRLSYQSGYQVELWLNYEGSFQVYETGITNRYGIVEFRHTCLNIPNIDCCLGFAKITINGQTYNSNIVRFNFVEGGPIEFEIDAGDCFSPPADRSSYNIFDASGRLLQIDRMFGGS
jgi:hypothetical protein